VGVASQRVAEATYEVLKRFGVDRVFGNPGSTEMRLFVRWPDDLDYVLALQESSVVAMADGYAQRSRRPGFANVHTAAGLGNAMGSIITAWRNQTPLVVTAGQQTRAMLPTEPYLSSPQSILLPQPYVKWAIERPRGRRTGRGGTRPARGDHAAVWPGFCVDTGRRLGRRSRAGAVARRRARARR
jgi:benzoylformate decarboxylase